MVFELHYVAQLVTCYMSRAWTRDNDSNTIARLLLCSCNAVNDSAQVEVEWVVK